MTAIARIATDRVPDVVLVPSESVFQRDGHTDRLQAGWHRVRGAPHRSGASGPRAGDREVRRGAGRSHRHPPAGDRDDSEDAVKRRMVRAFVFLAVIALGAAIAIAVPRLPERVNDTPDRARHEGPAQPDRARDGRAARGPHNDNRDASGRRHAAHRQADSDGHLGQGRRDRRRVRSGGPSVRAGAGEVRGRGGRTGDRQDEGGCAPSQAAQDQVTLLTARFDVRRAELDTTGQRVRRRHRGEEEPALAGRGEAPAGTARGRREVARRDESGVAGGRAGETQQGDARDAARAADDREPRRQGAARRRRVGETEHRCSRRHVFRGNGPAGVSRGRLDLAGPAHRRRRSSRAAWSSAPRSTRTIART